MFRPSGTNIRRSALGLCAGLLAGGTVYGDSISKPNILIILCDDLGYGDLGCYGQRLIRTPHLDRMAREGMRFTQAYAGSPVSAPSRASLMTGQHTGHTEVRGNREYWKTAPRVSYGGHEEYEVVGQHPYAPDHILLTEAMKAGGYSTGMFGKWAGGYEGSHSTPDKRGVDEYYGYICQFQAHLHYPNFLHRYSRSRGDTATVRVRLEENIPHAMFGKGYEQRTQYAPELIHREALAWLDAQTPDRPFFGLLTYTLPHAELAQPDDSLLDAYRLQFFHDHTWGGQEASRYNPSEHTHAQFAAMVSRLDGFVGEILTKLKEKGLDEQTLVLFTSDNGPHEEGGADPDFFGRDGALRGLKRSCHEGGIRVPFMVRWPGRIAAGVDNHHVLAFYDLMPTLCELTGQAADLETYRRKHPNALFDGLSFVPTLLGEAGQREHDFLYWEFGETDQMALRMGRWKLIVKRGIPELYDLQTDLHEDHDMARLHPKQVEQMIRVLHREHRPHALFPVTLPHLNTTR